MPNLLWLDLETTGLDPQWNMILEVAAYKAPITRPFAIERVGSWVIGAQPAQFDRMDAFVRNMHTQNGLIDECLKSNVDVFDVQDKLCAVVPELLDRDERVILAGSTIHFDKGFLNRHMPKLHARLSHRLYDVSAIKLFCHSLGMEKPAKAEAHRAEDDILESVVHAATCVKWLALNGFQPKGLSK